MTQPPPPTRPWLTRNLKIVSLVSLLQDAASELLYPLLPILLTTVLGAPAAVVGAVEGVAEGVAAVTKIVAGRFSDRWRKVPLVGLGYGLAAVGKVLVAAASVWPVVLLGRSVDRLGKGIRGAPRDSLLVVGIAREDRGRAFGFHRAADTAGAVIGPLLALVGYELLDHRIQPLLWIAVVPAVLSAGLVYALKEPAAAPVVEERAPGSPVVEERAPGSPVVEERAPASVSKPPVVEERASASVSKPRAGGFETGAGAPSSTTSGGAGGFETGAGAPSSTTSGGAGGFETGAGAPSSTTSGGAGGFETGAGAPSSTTGAPSSTSGGGAGPLGRPFWQVVGVLGVFSLVNFPDALLLLRLHDIGFSVVQVILAYVGYNVVYTLLSYPAGVVADRLSAQHVVAVGLLVFAVVYAGLGLTDSHLAAWLLMAGYGAYTGLTDGVGKAWVSRLLPRESQGTGQGLFQGVLGGGVLVAGVWAGLAWGGDGHLPLVVAGAVAGVVGAALLVVRLPAAHWPA